MNEGEIEDLRGQVELLQAQVEGLLIAARIFRAQRDQAQAKVADLAIELGKCRRVEEINRATLENVE
jgi:hypothetical protein